MDNTNIKLDDGKTPGVWINGKLAMKMRWLTDKWELGPNLSREYIEEKVPDLTILSMDWDLPNEEDNGVFWKREKNCLQLSMSCNRRFTNLNHASQMVLDELSRTLHMYCNVAQRDDDGFYVCEVWYEMR